MGHDAPGARKPRLRETLDRRRRRARLGQFFEQFLVHAVSSWPSCVACRELLMGDQVNERGSVHVLGIVELPGRSNRREPAALSYTFEALPTGVGLIP